MTGDDISHRKSERTPMRPEIVGSGESKETKLARGSILLILQGIIVTALGLVGFAFVARILTLEEMGSVVGLTLVSGLLIQLTDLGLSYAVAKHVAESRGKGEDYSRFIVAALASKALFGAVGGGAVVLFAEGLSTFLLKSPAYATAFQLVGVDVALSILNLVLTNSLLGLNSISTMVTLNILSAIVRPVVAIVSLVSGLGLPGYVLSWLLADLVFSLGGLLFLLRGRHVRLLGLRELSSTLGQLLSFSWPLYLSGLVQYFYSILDRSVLLALLPLAEVGVYNVAKTAFGVIMIVPSAISQALLPYYAEQYGSNQHDAIRNGIKAASRYVSLMYAPVGFGAMAVATATISLLAGTSYAGGDIILATLSLFSVLTSSGAAFGGIMLSYGMTGSILLIDLISIACGLLSSLVLVPPFGSLGIALTAGLMMVIPLLLTIAMMRRRIEVELDLRAILKSLIAAAIMAAVVGLVQVVYFDKYLLPVYMAIGALTYFLLLKILRATTPEDYRLARQVLGERMAFLVDIAERLLL
jgi:O-antigen/teichoic acid export membrane protein